MSRPIIADCLRHQLTASSVDDTCGIDDLRRFGGVEAQIQVAERGSAPWRFLDTQDREIASGRATALRRCDSLT